MKNLILTLLAIFTVTLAFADVVVQDINNVVIAGANVGKVADACANHPAKRAEVQTALETYIAELLAAKAAAEKSLTNIHAEALAAKTEALAAKAAAEKSLADTQDFTADLLKRAKAASEKKDLKQIAALIAEGETPAKQRTLEALRAEKEKIEQQITELK